MENDVFISMAKKGDDCDRILKQLKLEYYNPEINEYREDFVTHLKKCEYCSNGFDDYNQLRFKECDKYTDVFVTEWLSRAFVIDYPKVRNWIKHYSNCKRCQKKYAIANGNDNLIGINR